VCLGDIFGNREQLEEGYIWSNDMRVSRIKADDGRPIGVCEFFTRPFFKPPSVEFDGRGWIKLESCGSCSTFVFGNLKEQAFADIYNNEMMQEVRNFLYRKYTLPRERWMFPCRNCLCVDQIYSNESNGRPNAGKRFFPGDNLYEAPERPDASLLKRGWRFLQREGLRVTTRETLHFVKKKIGARPGSR
jgi:hypothetical protein